MSTEKQPKPSFFDRALEGVRSAIYEEPPENGDSGTEAVPPTTSTDQPVFRSASSTVGASASGPRLVSRLNQEVVASIRAKVDEKSSEGYRKLNELLAELESDIPDERTRYRVAMKSMSKMGFDGAAVSALYNQRVAFLQSFSNDFEDALKQRLDSVTSQSKDEIADLDRESTRLAQEIADRTAELNDVQRKRATIASKQQSDIDHLTEKSTETREAIIALAAELTTERDKTSRFIS